MSIYDVCKEARRRLGNKAKVRVSNKKMSDSAFRTSLMPARVRMRLVVNGIGVELHEKSVTISDLEKDQS